MYPGDLELDTRHAGASHRFYCLVLDLTTGQATNQVQPITNYNLALNRTDGKLSINVNQATGKFLGGAF